MEKKNRVAIMQPYFLPYIGYWQLMFNVDTFVVYDDIEYTKKGWINKNRFLLNGQPEVFTLPLKKDSDFINISKRQLIDQFELEKQKLFRRWQAAYIKAPYFESTMHIIEMAMSSKSTNLFEFIFHSIGIIRDYLHIDSKVFISSQLEIDRELKGQKKVINICSALGATDYVNPIGGVALYSESAFRAAGITLHFQQVRPISYPQYDKSFVPNLSILDMLMFCGCEHTRNLLAEMDLDEPSD